MARGLNINRRLLKLISMCGKDAFDDGDDCSAHDNAFLYLANSLLPEGADLSKAIDSINANSHQAEIFIYNLMDVGVLIKKGGLISISPEHIIEGR